MKALRYSGPMGSFRKRPIGTVRPGMPALLPGSVFWMNSPKLARLDESGFEAIATFGTVGKSSAGCATRRKLDLSQVIFIATANVADTIPGPLLDRMEVIRFDGYTVAEKAAIARDYLWPRQRERNGLREDEVATPKGRTRNAASRRR